MKKEQMRYLSHFFSTLQTLMKTFSGKPRLWVTGPERYANADMAILQMQSFKCLLLSIDKDWSKWVRPYLNQVRNTTMLLTHEHLAIVLEGVQISQGLRGVWKLLEQWVDLTPPHHQLDPFDDYVEVRLPPEIATEHGKECLYLKGKLKPTTRLLRSVLNGCSLLAVEWDHFPIAAREVERRILRRLCYLFVRLFPPGTDFSMEVSASAWQRIKGELTFAADEWAAASARE